MSLSRVCAGSRRCALLLGLAMTAATVANASTEATPAENRLPLAELQALTDALARIKASYVEPVDDKQLLEGAIAGMLATLDPHSSFLNGKDLNRLTESTRGEYGGVGLEVSPENVSFRVVTAMDDSPAQRAGIRTGDLLLRINNELTRGLKFEEVVSRLRGAPGSKVSVQLGREGESKPLDIELVRDIIQTASVRHELLDSGIGYVRITQFQQDTGTEVIGTLDKLKAANGGALRGLILDMRNNPGGVVAAAAAVADAFLTEGVIVSTKGRSPGSDTELKARADDRLHGAPIVVLINQGSASAAEIVAGALQDHQRAILVGSRSFGKGSVQTVHKLSGEAAIKLTTARYYTPSGRSIQAAGIEPDVPVGAGKFVADAPRAGVREADLPHALGRTAQTSEKTLASKVNGRDIADDIQLATAIHLLRGLAVLQK